MTAAREQPTLKASGRRAVHPIYVGPGPYYDVMRSAMRRVNYLPQHPDDETIADCITPRPEAVCRCGAYRYEWV